MSRMRFVADLESCLRLTELCEKHGISRKTGYKWAQRYSSEGVEGLKDRSRAPKLRPAQTPTEVAQRLCRCALCIPPGDRGSCWLGWRSTKRSKTGRRRAPSAGSEARRVVLPSGRRSGRTRPSEGPPRGHDDQRGLDLRLQGAVCTGDGLLCYPRTVVDSFSRFVLVIHGFPSVAGDLAWSAFEQAFRCCGYPRSSARIMAAPLPLFGHCRPVPALRALAQAGHSRRAHRAGSSRAERPARANAPHPQSGNNAAAGG